MKILIVSDTHGRHQALDRALEEAGKIDMFIHLGDVEGGEDYLEAVVECEKHIIRGNNDFFTELPREEEFEIGPYHAFITHGHYYYVSMDVDTIIEEARSRNAKNIYNRSNSQKTKTKETICTLFLRKTGKKTVVKK